MTDAAALVLLLDRIGGGDKAAFAEFYRAMERPVFRFVASKLNESFEAADISHEVFMEIWRSAAKFEGRSAVRTWVFGIAYRKTMDHFRKHGRVTVSDDIPEQIDESPDATSCLVATEEAAHVRHCLGTLKPDHRMAVEMAFYEDLGYAEIARAVEVPEGTVKTHIFHAKKLLMRCLEGRMGRVTA